MQTDNLRELLRRKVAGGPPVAARPSARLLARLEQHHLTAALAPLLPPGDPDLERAVATARARTAGLLLELERVLPDLEAQGAEPVVLKGAGLALGVYPDPLERWFVDLDVLIRRERVEAACEALMARGYVPIEPERFATYYDRYHLHRALVGPSRGVVELHWDLAIPVSIYRHDPAGVRARARAAVLGRRACRVASPADQILHGLGQQVTCGFRDPRRVLDLALLLPHLDDAGRRDVAALARAGRLERALELWLAAARELAGVEAPPLLPEPALGPAARRLLARLEVADGLENPRACPLEGRARFLHLVLVPGWRLRLRELLRLLFPGDFHLEDAGRDPRGWRGQAARLRMGLRHARQLLRLQLRALGIR